MMVTMAQQLVCHRRPLLTRRTAATLATTTAATATTMATTKVATAAEGAMAGV